VQDVLGHQEDAGQAVAGCCPAEDDVPARPGGLARAVAALLAAPGVSMGRTWRMNSEAWEAMDSAATLVEERVAMAGFQAPFARSSVVLGESLWSSIAGSTPASLMAVADVVRDLGPQAAAGTTCSSSLVASARVAVQR